MNDFLPLAKNHSYTEVTSNFLTSNSPRSLIFSSGMTSNAMNAKVINGAYSVDPRRLEPGTKSRSSKEVEAESVAFTVCTYLGLDTSDYSFTYVGTWAGGLDTKVLMESMETIRKCAADIIKKIEETVGCAAADMGVSEEVA